MSNSTLAPPTLRRQCIFASAAYLFASVCLPTSTSTCLAQDRLPPIRQLIAETLTLCNTDREYNGEPLGKLAEALCYLGDFAAARKTLLPYESGDFNIKLAHQNCAQIEIE